MRQYADQWTWILLGWGIACLGILAVMAGTELVIPTTKEVDLFTRILNAFTEVCGPAPFLVFFLGGGIGGYLAADATRSAQP